MRFVLAFYEIDRSWGGSEEGGWWYDTGTLVRVHRVESREDTAIAIAARANRLLERLQRCERPVSSVAYDGGRHRLIVFAESPPRRFPTCRPTYH